MGALLGGFKVEHSPPPFAFRKQAEVGGRTIEGHVLDADTRAQGLRGARLSASIEA